MRQLCLHHARPVERSDVLKAGPSCKRPGSCAVGCTHLRMWQQHCRRDVCRHNSFRIHEKNGSCLLTLASWGAGGAAAGQAAAAVRFCVPGNPVPGDPQ